MELKNFDGDLKMEEENKKRPFHVVILERMKKTIPHIGSSHQEAGLLGVLGNILLNSILPEKETESISDSLREMADGLNPTENTKRAKKFLLDLSEEIRKDVPKVKALEELEECEPEVKTLKELNEKKKEDAKKYAAEASS